MIDLLELHKFFLARHIRPADSVADFTMGGGADTLWLSRAVGPRGKVYAFDLQEEALTRTSERLARAGAPRNVTLICDSHANLRRYIHEPIRAGVFNLGWLPGGDHTLTTRHESTLVAVRDAAALLAPDGVLLIAVYPGHPEGAREGEMLGQMLSDEAAYPRREYCNSLFRIQNSPRSPYFYLMERK